MSSWLESGLLLRRKALTTLTLLGTLILAGGAKESAVFLKPPGLRLVKDPSTVIPAFQHYPNQNLALPSYQDRSGKLKEGWAMKVIRTRRFFSHRSARLYLRTADLARSIVFNPSGSSKEMRIWPPGTFIVLEIYKGDGATSEGAEPIEITVMAKLGALEKDPSTAFHPTDWSYARYTPRGKPSLGPDQVLDCHHCHSIAFHLTGDLIFTQFP